MRVGVCTRLAVDHDDDTTLGITRLVVDAEGVPLDVGRTQRLYTGEMRRAVFARDRHCAYPGCTRPPQWGEVHHIRWWSHGGTTSLNNAVLLCLRHHHLVHEDHLTIRRLPPDPADPATGRTRRGGLLPQARYEFRGPDGRLVGPWRPSGPQPARSACGGDLAPTDIPRPRFESSTAVRAPAGLFA
ncbi:HNH endonuclease signature motif containing protein [Cellulomonas endophytica]|uniref:HNH endonuclease signature motif containing protein n=1 Tax=Cellulomonas endophytica TaxID=2494735 RepID=UPI00196B6BBB|nr:HNH endonuclease signature motif containing protein [Cellulomonas endophytica]